jgi:hypothetical protein
MNGRPVSENVFFEESLRGGFKTLDRVRGRGAGRRKRTVRPRQMSFLRRLATPPSGLRRGFETASRLSTTLIERKSRVPQIQGVQGRSWCKYQRAPDNTEDEVSSAFPKGSQNGVVFGQFRFHPCKRYKISAYRLKKALNIVSYIRSPFCLRSFRVQK